MEIAIALLLVQSALPGPELALAQPALLGQPVELRVESPQPDALAWLLASPKAGSIALPFGVLELDPAGLVLLAAGSTGASASLALSFPTQAAVAAAEAEVHAQAVVLDPATASLSVTNALHFRLRSSRAYVGVDGMAAPGRLQAWSTTTRTLIFSVLAPIGPASEDSTAGADELPRVVTSRDGLLAAFVSNTPALVVFDDSFGTIEHEIPLVAPARQLALDANGTGVHVLQPAAGLLSRIDLAGGTIQATLALPGPCTSEWTVSADRRTAYVALVSAAGAPARIARIDLDALALTDVTDVFPAPTPGAKLTVDDLGLSGERLVVVGTSFEFLLGPQWHAFGATLDYAQQPPSVTSASEQGAGWTDLLVAPEFGAAIAVRNAFFLYGLTYVGFPIANPGAFAPFAPWHPFTASGPPVLCHDADRLWVLNDDNHDSNYQLFELDWSSWVWKQHWINGWCLPGPHDLALVADAYSDLVVLIVESHPLACPQYQGQVAFLDAETGATLALHGAGGLPRWVDAVVVP